MKLSTRGRYGVRFMVDLAGQYGKGPIFLTDVVARQDVSQKYLGHLIRPLKAKGLISSQRGVKGGYVLAKPPDEISLKDVLDVVEGPLCIVGCVDDAAVCNRSAACIFRDVWSETSEKIGAVFASVTLAQMAARQEEKEKTNHDKAV
ncbi:MAG: Rrf2 family transcriptional regulator [Deltaproteobacteria bacterium]|nr:Rrf2 family transcriptional regulator [Deltaproteobacteria bacterium]